MALARLKVCAPLTMTGMIVMNVRQLRISRRSVTIAAALVGVVSLAIGANAALNKRALDTARAVATAQSGEVPNQASRIALVIGNGHYPDANAPLAQPINDARALTAQLRRTGFDVDVVEDASRDDMQRAIGRLKSKIRPDTVVLLFFGGYGVQVGRESYMIPVDAAIWKEADVRRQGVSFESVLEAMKEQGARAKLVVIDASRRNPYERRFPAFSPGPAPLAASRSPRCRRRCWKTSALAAPTRPAARDCRPCEPQGPILPGVCCGQGLWLHLLIDRTRRMGPCVPQGRRSLLSGLAG